MGDGDGEAQPRTRARTRTRTRPRTNTPRHRAPPRVQVPLPRLHNPMTDLLAPAAAPRALRGPRDRRRKHAFDDGVGVGGADAGEQQQQEAAEAAAAGGGGEDGGGEDGFVPAPRFAGARPGFVFKKGPSGVGYYRDDGPFARRSAAAAAAAPAAPSTQPAAAAGGGGAAAGWVGMRTVAELRRELGVGAPRERDSLYRPVERGVRVFNPLKVPKKLQAALPFKTKPKIVSRARSVIWHL